MNGRMSRAMPPARMARTREDAQLPPCMRRSMPMHDQQLVLALTGSTRVRALVECIRRLGRRAKRTAWRITANDHRADDVCQAVFLVLVRKAASLAAHTTPGAWLHQVTVLTARDVVKSEA